MRVNNREVLCCNTHDQFLNPADAASVTGIPYAMVVACMDGVIPSYRGCVFTDVDIKDVPEGWVELHGVKRWDKYARHIVELTSGSVFKNIHQASRILMIPGDIISDALDGKFYAHMEHKFMWLNIDLVGQDYIKRHEGY